MRKYREYSSQRQRANPRMQPTAFGAQDRWFFEAIMCCAPSAAADAQAVSRTLSKPPSGNTFCLLIPRAICLW